MATNRSDFVMAAVPEEAYDFPGQERPLEAERKNPAAAGFLTGMRGEDPVEGRTVPSCCSCCVALKEEDAVEGHMCWILYHFYLDDRP